MTEQVQVAAGATPYSVVVSADGFGGLELEVDRALPGASPGVLVTEATVQPLWADTVLRTLQGRVRATLVLPPGEANKTVAQWSRCVDGLLGLGVDRHTPVFALGGGVLGDVAGFAASVTLRGLPVVQLPTTTLAMVDSSVGGKTAINHPSGKNLVGAFHQPRLVWASLSTLLTLAPEEHVAGLAEAVKIAALCDPHLLGFIEGQSEALRRLDRDAMVRVVSRSVELKAAIVAQDEREQGRRAVLNLGHTVAHGLETALGHGRLRHGEAVAIGLVAETRWAVKAGLCANAALPSRLAEILGSLGLPTAIPAVDGARVEAAMRVDKKARSDKMAVPVLTEVGTAVLVQLPIPRLTELLERG